MPEAVSHSTSTPTALSAKMDKQKRQKECERAKYVSQGWGCRREE